MMMLTTLTAKQHKIITELLGTDLGKYVLMEQDPTEPVKILKHNLQEIGTLPLDKIPGLKWKAPKK